jgi:hypothetical protein
VLRRSTLRQPNTEDLYCIGTDLRVQPVTPSIDSNHRFVTRELTRTIAAAGLSVCLPHLVVNRDSTRFNA